MPNPTSHDVLSAFLDNEPFDATELASALAEPGGRELLLDLMALRHLVQDDPSFVPPIQAPAIRKQRRVWVAAGFLAATVIFGVASALVAPSLFSRNASDIAGRPADMSAPPRPDRVVKFEPGLDWHDNETPGASGVKK